MQITTFLMFDGNAQSALRSYVALFPDSRIVSLELYAPGERGSAGSVKRAIFELNGVRYRCVDTPVHHDFNVHPGHLIVRGLATTWLSSSTCSRR